jgi:thiol-disulfide isomerase/thioredoxin
MTSILRTSGTPLLILALALAGCGEAGDTNVAPTPESTSPAVSTATPSSPETSPAAPAPAAPATESSPVPEKTAAPATAPAPAPEKAEVAAKDAEATPTTKVESKEGAFELKPVKFDEFLKRVANKDAKFTLVDVWASWCVPCKENFPHLVEMHHKYADKGLSVASLSFDDPAEPKQVADAKEFLDAKKAAFANYLLDEEQGVGYEKLNIGAIPAVFIYGPDGKEVKRYTMDDVNNQFTYEQVEKDVVALLDGKPLPKEEKSKPAEK